MSKYKIISNSVYLFIILNVIILILISCTSHLIINDEAPVWKDNDKKPIKEPKINNPSIDWISVNRSTFDPLLQILDFKRHFKKLANVPQQALNVNSLDEVPNSSWFNNRHNLPYTKLNYNEIYKGSNITDGPDTNGFWWIINPLLDEVNPSFYIEDSKGNKYKISFDPIGYPELATGASIIGSRYFYACGYNVQEEKIIYWFPEILRIKEGSTFENENGELVPFTNEYLKEFLSKLEHQSDGSIRSLASHSLGNIKGPFMYKGIRKDDPNDWCPHEHRRELRALYVIGSLVNHHKLKEQNNVDVYIERNGGGYLKHYLINFRNILGSDGNKPKLPKKGYDHKFDIRDIGTATITLGAKKREWKESKPYKYNSIGYFESEIFKPREFAPIYSNPAFENLTIQDAYWGAKTVMAFRDNDLKALVDAARYSDSSAVLYLLRTLKERRDKIGKYWFSQVNPIDYPDVKYDNDKFIVTFEDLLIKYKLNSDRVTYFCKVYINNKYLLERKYVDIQKISFEKSKLFDVGSIIQNNHGEVIIKFKIKSFRENTKLSPYTNFIFKVNFESKEAMVIGIEHEA
jgi:hypothetical protein